MEDITPSELKQRFDRHEHVKILDVREVWEFENDNLGGQNIPLGELPESLDKIQGSRDEELVVMCRSGNRSSYAKKFLEEHGYTKVRNLLEGILGVRDLD